MGSIVEYAPKAERRDAAWLPNDALSKAAGPFAERVAKIYPRPHAEFLSAEPARRRLMAIALMRSGVEQTRPHAEALAHWSLNRAQAVAVADAPHGLIAALRKYQGLETWEAFARLLALLAEPMAAKVLFHAAAIDAELLAKLVALPPALRRARIVALLGSWYEANIVAQAVNVAVRRSDQVISVEKIAEVLERARTPYRMYEALLAQSLSETTAGQALPACDFLRPVVTALDLRRTALKYRNCLDGYIGRIGRGAYAAYEVLGDEPACLGLFRSQHGWVIDQLYGVGNACVSAALNAKVAAFCVEHGACTQARPDAVLVRLADLLEAA
jgi:hypothetical protein